MNEIGAGELFACSQTAENKAVGRLKISMANIALQRESAETVAGFEQGDNKAAKNRHSHFT
jgi:hypothetical protein